MYENGFGDFENDFHIVVLRKMSPSRQKEYIKELWEENPKAYFEWKEMCIKLDQLPDIFGTSDDPIPIDESKL